MAFTKTPEMVFQNLQNSRTPLESVIWALGAMVGSLAKDNEIKGARYLKVTRFGFSQLETPQDRLAAFDRATRKLGDEAEARKVLQLRARDLADLRAEVNPEAEETA